MRETAVFLSLELFWVLFRVPFLLPVYLASSSPSMDSSPIVMADSSVPTCLDKDASKRTESKIMQRQKLDWNTNRNGSAFGGAGDGDQRALQNVGRGAGSAAHFALERRQFARHAFL